MKDALEEVCDDYSVNDDESTKGESIGVFFFLLFERNDWNANRNVHEMLAIKAKYWNANKTKEATKKRFQ